MDLRAPAERALVELMSVLGPQVAALPAEVVVALPDHGRGTLGVPRSNRAEQALSRIMSPACHHKINCGCWSATTSRSR